MSAALEYQLNRIRASALFDAEWYRREYPDVEEVGIDPAEHYLRVGADLLRDPGANFSTRYYLELHQDVASAGLNALFHFEAYGRQEERGYRSAVLGCEPERFETGLPDVDGVLSALKAVRRHPGCLPLMAGCSTILVCAHTSGENLFGSERSLLDVIDGFGQIDYNVVVATPANSNAQYLDALQQRCHAVLEFSYGWWGAGIPVDESAVATFARLIHEWRITAVHANTIMLREPLIAARRMSVPGSVHVRELIMHDAALSTEIGLSPDEIVGQVLASADHIIANSHATGRCFEKSGASHYLPNTVDVEQFDIPHAVDPANISIALVSSNLPKKGLYEFVEIARILGRDTPQARLLLIGPDNEHTTLLKQEQAAGKVPRNLVFAGYCEHPVSAMRDADIVVNLSHFQESFGRSVLEAMAARRAVVAYEWGAVPELVVDGETGFLIPFGDVARCAERLAELCSDPRRLVAMGEAGRKRAVSLYDKNRFAERLEEAYERILTLDERKQAPPRLVLPARSDLMSEGSHLPLNIAYFLWHFPVPSETFVLNELRILVEQGHDVKVYCRQSPHPEFTPDFPVDWQTVASAEGLAQALIDTGRTIVHSHFTYPTVTEMVWPACEQARIPFTFIAHAQDIFRYSNDENNHIGEIARSAYCRRVVVPSRFHRDYVAQRGVPREKILINPNGIDPMLYRDGRVEDRSSRRHLSICAIHRFTEKKGLEQLIRAGHKLADEGIHIHLYGYGDLELQYRQVIAELRLTNVHLHGPVKGRVAMLDVFRQHDLFACPSVRAADGDMDGIPTVLMEAMASGLPVLTTGISGIPDLVRHETSGFVCQADAGSIANAVREFYALEDALVEAVIEQAERVVERDFNVARTAAALVRLWQHATIDIMIVSWNNLPQLREVIRRLYAFTTAAFHLVICDNGSNSDVTAYLCELYAGRDNVTVILNRENAMVGPGTNICLEHSASKYAVYVCGKEGFVLDFGWERRLIDYMDANPEVGLAGTLCHSPSYLHGSEYPAGIALFPEFRNPGFATDNSDRVFAHVQGGFFVMRRAMYESIGGFSQIVAHSYTDVEYSYYAESMGWSLGSPSGLLSLYNKTRPGIFTRVDESVAAIHPPTLDDLPVLDAISARAVRHCNLCNWHGDEFRKDGGARMCPGCGSRPADRSLYRFLAESTLTYRRLPAVGVGVGEALATIWRQQFQGGLLTTGEFTAELSVNGRLEFGDRGMKLIYIDAEQLQPRSFHAASSEASRLLSDDGVLLVRASSAGGANADVATGMADSNAGGAFSLRRQVRYSSAVSRFDWHPLLVFERAGACVS